MAVVTDAFFQPAASPGGYLATPHTVGPWDGRLQHAGPPSALVTRAIEATPSSIEGPTQLARITVEILSGVPVGEVVVSAAVARPGRSVELVEAELAAGGRPVLRARAWRVRLAKLDLPDDAVADAPPHPPRPEAPARFTVPHWRVGYLEAIEWRFAEGHFERPGPATAWARQRMPLVAGEEPTGPQRLMLLADSGNGLSQMLDVGRWWFINTELTVHLHREPAGEWLCLRASSTLSDTGVGLAETELYDEEGRIGRGAQALLVGPRPS
jgi:Thioesterase-like superfamily